MNSEKEWNCPDIPEEVLELSNTMRVRKTNGPKFPQKLKTCLDFVTENPKFVNWVGVAWVGEDKFMCNVEFLARILHVKRNSINKNFSNFGFEALVGTRPPHQYKGFNIDCIKLWIVRQNTQAEFSMHAETPDIKPKKTYEINQFIDDFLSRISDKNLAKSIYDDLLKDESWKQQALTEAICNWNEITGKHPEPVPQDVAEYIVSQSKNSMTYDITGLIMTLLQGSCVSSQVMTSVKFTDYFRLFLRFGNLQSIGANVFNVSENGRFRGWFLPTTETALAASEALRQQFVVKLSSTSATRFSVVRSCMPTINIECDVLAEPENIYSADSKSAGRIVDLLEELGLYQRGDIDNDLPIGSQSNYSQYSQNLSQFCGCGIMDNQGEFDFGV